MAHAPDEFLSAMLDGEPAPGDAAHVAECDVCQARLDELRSAALAVATPVAPPPGHIREAAMREALLVADDKTHSSGRLLPFRRRTSTRRTSPLSAAAALLVAVLVGGFALSQIGHGNGNDRLAQTVAAPNANTAKSAAGAIGSVDEIGALITRAKSELARSSKLRDTSQTTTTTCPFDGDGTLLWQATTTYEGRAAVAHYIKRGDTNVMQILAAADCSLIATRDSAPTTPR